MKQSIEHKLYHKYNWKDITIELWVKRLWLLSADKILQHGDIYSYLISSSYLYSKITAHPQGSINKMPLPGLATLPEIDTFWLIAVLNAYQKLNQIYQTASSYLDSESFEAHQLWQYGNAIITDAYPLLLLLEESAEEKSIPHEWIENIATQFMQLLHLVDEKWMLEEGRCVSALWLNVLLESRY